MWCRRRVRRCHIISRETSPRNQAAPRPCMRLASAERPHDTHERGGKGAAMSAGRTPRQSVSGSFLVGKLFGHLDQELARLAALDLVEGLHDADRARGLHEAENAL